MTFHRKMFQHFNAIYLNTFFHVLSNTINTILNTTNQNTCSETLIIFNKIIFSALLYNEIKYNFYTHYPLNN